MYNLLCLSFEEEQKIQNLLGFFCIYSNVQIYSYIF